MNLMRILSGRLQDRKSSMGSNMVLMIMLRFQRGDREECYDIASLKDSEIEHSMFGTQ